MKVPIADKDASFIETPNGIFTAAGHWFHTTIADLKQYAEPVLAHRSIDWLLNMAARWLGSPKTLMLWSIPPLLWTLGVLPTLGIAVAVYLLFAIWGPVLTSLTVSPVLRLLDQVWAQGLFYVIGMSWFAINDQFLLMGIGLVLFIVIRWGLVDQLFKPLLDKVHARMYAVPYPDQVLKSVIVRAAMKHRVSLPELDEMERFILNRLTRK
ncbi:MAG: hypothetical protein AAF564_08835 [Bacteroidota bacterium]